MFKKTGIKVLLALLSLSLLLAFAACDKNPDADNGTGDGNTATEFDYSIALKDASGVPVSNMIIKILNGDQTEVMKLVDDASGGVVSGTLAIGTYGIEVLSPSNKSFYYDKSITVSADAPNATVVIYDLASSCDKQELVFGFEGKYSEYEAPLLTSGAYRVELSDGMAYFVFVPEMRGKYKITVCDNENASIGYHGGVFYVQEPDLCGADSESDIYKTEDGVFLNMRSYHLGEDIQSASKFVFSVSCEASGCSVKIERIGDLEYNTEELPWQEVVLPSVPDKAVIPNAGNVVITDFDLTDPELSAVYNEEDGFYHLSDVNGPIIYVRLKTKSKYVEATIEQIAENNRIGAYVYDESGKVISKTSYHNMMLQYIAATDDTYGVYPLTSYLRDAIFNFGEMNGWWQLGMENIFFGKDSINFVSENAWLFAACYFSDDNT